MSERSRPFMVSLRLREQRVVVVGGDDAATAKVETLLGTGAELVLIDDDPTARLRDLAASGTLTWRTGKVRRRDLRGAALVIISDAVDLVVAKRIAKRARRLGVLVNIVDTPAECDLTIPASIDVGPATIAISTNGASPAGARFLREQLTDALPEGMGALLHAAGDARAELRASGRYRYDYNRWRDAFFEPGLQQLTLDGALDTDALAEQFVAEFNEPAPTTGASVALVGAGPGGADLITLRGARLLQRADVVLYDGLADPALLAMAPVAAQRIPVAKRKGEGAHQDHINDLLVEHAILGRRVVRLKGGDPFVFGRGAEEAAAVAAAGFPVEVVPGLSSSLAGPALAGISVTDRNHASAITVLSGHRVGDNVYDWEAIGRSGATLVVLMAATTADAVATQLRRALPADHPVAFVHAAGRPEQRVAHVSLAEAAEQGCPFPSPSIMVSGEAARDRAGLAHLTGCIGDRDHSAEPAGR